MKSQRSKFIVKIPWLLLLICDIRLLKIGVSAKLLFFRENSSNFLKMSDDFSSGIGRGMDWEFDDGHGNIVGMK